MPSYPDQDPVPAHTVPRPSPGLARRRTAGWAAGLLLTTLNGIVVGYGVLWFQVFSATPDVEDYRVSAGGYLGAAAVLAFALAALLTRPAAPWWLHWTAGTSSAVLAALGGVSILESTSAEQVGTPVDGFWDGVGGVVWAPWTWVMVTLEARALVGRARGRGSIPAGRDQSPPPASGG